MSGLYSRWTEGRPDVAKHCYVIRAGVQLTVRSGPSHDAEPTGRILKAGERIEVSERIAVENAVQGATPQTFLKIADAEGGWAFSTNRRTGVAVVEEVALAPPTAYDTIESFAYAWDEKKGLVTVYVTLAGVHELPKGAVSVHFGERSFDLKVRGAVNRRLVVPELYDMIDPPRCRCRVKKDKVVLLLKTGHPAVPFSAWQKLSSGAADPAAWGANPDA
jgi:hypothetical protein